MLRGDCQIESGRRKDVRLSSLVALADALDVSVDYLLGRMPSMTPLLRHRAFLYDTVETFTESVLPFLREGASASWP